MIFWVGYFLFNVLNSFYAKTLKHNVPELSDGLLKLAELTRYMVYETNEDKVLLEREIRHLKNFIEDCLINTALLILLPPDSSIPLQF